MCKLPWASLVAQTIKNLPAVLETWVQSLGWEDPLGKGTATHSSILAWRVPWTEKSGEPQSMGSQRVRHNWATFTLAPFLFYNFAFRELYHRTVCVSFSHLKMQQCFQYFIMSMTAILHAIKISNHLLEYRLGYCEAIVLTALGDHKVIILLLLGY